MDKLESYFWNTHRAFTLALSHERIIPGAVLETRWKPTWPLPWLIDTNPEFRRYEGMAWERLGIDGKRFASELQKAGILVGTLVDRFDFGAGVSLPQFGLNVSLGFSETVHARLEVSDVRVRLFKNGFAGHDLRRKLRALKDDNDPRYADVDNNFLVVESFYLEGLRWQFSNDGASHFQAELETTGVDLSAQSDVEWETKTALRFSGCSRVPVAIRGMKI